MVSLFTASTIEDTDNGVPQRQDSFFYNAEDDLSFSQWHSHRHGHEGTARDSQIVYERVFEPHPSLLKKNGTHKTYTSKVFVSRRPSCSPAAAMAAQWRASQPSSAASSTASSPSSSSSLSSLNTRTSTFSGASTMSKSSKASANERVSAAFSRVMSMVRRPSSRSSPST